MADKAQNRSESSLGERPDPSPPQADDPMTPCHVADEDVAVRQIIISTVDITWTPKDN
jgi:hypothetical protein